jgi:glucose-1-phosphate thymidylyltransferase
MRGIILAGGTGSRLYPLTKVTNKHLLPVGRKPMIFYPIERLIEVGITEILVVTGVDHMGDLVNMLGSGKDFGCNFTYKVQDKALGIAQALQLAKSFAGNEKTVVLLGDNIFGESLSMYVKKFEKQKTGARVLIKEVPDPERFGVAEIKGDRIISIEEKPKKPKSKFVITGIYMYDQQVFDMIKGLKPSKRGELEISDVNAAYLKRGELEYDILSSWWTDAGTFETLERASLLVEGKVKL